MIYPKDFEYKTGFEQIRKLLESYCISSLGKKRVEKIEYLDNYSIIKCLLQQTEEFRQILFSGENFPAADYFDLEEVFEKVKLEGTYFEAGELKDLWFSLLTIARIIKFLLRKKDQESFAYPNLAKLAEKEEVDPQIIEAIKRILDLQGNIKDNASETLSDIRYRRLSLESKAEKRINQIVHQAKSEKWLDSDVELSIRNGRLVIPVPSAYKRRIKGYVHDQSATGQTVYLEPSEIFEINNEIKELDFEELQEIIRILKEFTDFFRPHLPVIKSAYSFLGIVDCIRAKAKLAVELNAQMPKLISKPAMNWINAIHPLLYLSFRPQKKKVETLNITLSEKQRILIISGPNAGGKSVALKTCGLLQYMLQCGLLVPMENYSEAGIFEKIFIDIGDEQSIENDLSTYSSHLLAMRNFSENINEKSLFLIDEFGAGTEPKIGGAIAESILNELNEKQAYGVITTHYANLKLFAAKQEGVINGSMMFDTKNIKPLYVLKIGNPGSSFAFEIAKTIGLSDSVLNRAEQLAGKGEVDFDRQLQEMDLKKLELEEKEKQLRSADNFLSELIDKYEKLHKNVESRKDDMLNEARREAKKILSDSNSIIERTVKQIKESAADKNKTAKLRKDLNDYISDLESAIDEKAETVKPEKKKWKEPKKQQQNFEPDNSPISKGSNVRMKGLQTPGEVIDIDGKEAIVSFGSMKMKVPVSKLEKIKQTAASKAKAKVKLSFDINEKAVEFKTEIDVRGKRAEEALRKIRHFIDDAILLGSRNLKIVHGKGDGILRVAIRDMLSTIPEVRRYKDDHPDRGGAGTTLVEIDI